MKTTLLICAMLFIGFNASGQQQKITNQKFQKSTNVMQVYKKSLYIDTLVSLRLSYAKLNELKKNKVNLSQKASELLSDYAEVSSEVNQPIIVSQKILENGGIETIYDDKSKRIKDAGGITVISPDGEMMRMSFLQTPPFEPPTDPGDPNLVTYLNNIQSALSESLSALLDNDSESLVNFQNGDQGLSIYQRINRRTAIIEYLISQP